MTTIRHVARVAGVSIATVSATLNGSKRVSEPLRMRVLAAVEKVGYAPNGIAQSLKRGATHTLGLIVPDVTNPLFSAVARAAEASASARGYAMLLCNTDEDAEKERSYLRLMRMQRVAGLILAPVGAGPDYAAGLSTAVRCPAVMVDRTVQGLPWDSVATANAEGARQAVAHLVALGHRTIGAIFARSEVSTSTERLEGYRQALKEAGIRTDSNLVRLDAAGYERSRHAAQALLALSPRPTAVFASNNAIMLGVLQAVRDRGLRCPYDVSIVGFDGFNWADAMAPPMTTVEQPSSEMGTRAVTLLLERLDGRTAAPRHETLPPHFIGRASGAPPSDR